MKEQHYIDGSLPEFENLRHDPITLDKELPKNTKEIVISVCKKTYNILLIAKDKEGRETKFFRTCSVRLASANLALAMETLRARVKDGK